MKGEWGTINYRSWDIRDASVVCRMLGYQYTIQADRASSLGFRSGSGPIWFGYLNCLGSERSIADCSIDTSRLYTRYYYHYDAGVVCSTGWHLIIDSTVCSNLYYVIYSGTSLNDHLSIKITSKLQHIFLVPSNSCISRCTLGVQKSDHLRIHFYDHYFRTDIIKITDN